MPDVQVNGTVPIPCVSGRPRVICTLVRALHALRAAMRLHHVNLFDYIHSTHAR